MWKHLAVGLLLLGPGPCLAQETFVPVLAPPEGWKEDPRRVKASPDGRHVAYILESESGFAARVIWDGEEGPEYDRIDSLGFSPDSRRVHYLAMRGGKWFVVVDHAPVIAMAPEEGAGSEVRLREVLYSPSSRQIVCVVKEQDEQTVYLDGKALSSHSDNVTDLRFSSDEEHLCYRSRVYIPSIGSPERLFLDGKQLRPPAPRAPEWRDAIDKDEYNLTPSFAFHPDSSELSYVVALLYGGLMYPVTMSLASEEARPRVGPGLSGGLERIFYTAGATRLVFKRIGDEGWLSIDHERVKGIDGSVEDLQFSAAGTDYLFRLAKGKMRHVRWGRRDLGPDGGPFTEVRSLSFDSSGDRIAFFAVKKNPAGEARGIVVVHDGKDVYRSRALGTAVAFGPIFSSDGRHWAFLGSDDAGFLFLQDGDTIRLEFPVDPPAGFALSPDGAAVAFVARGSRPPFRHVVFRGKSGPVFDAIQRIRIGPRSRHVTYWGQRAGQWHLVVDDKVSAWSMVPEGHGRRLAFPTVSFQNDGAVEAYPVTHQVQSAGVRQRWGRLRLRATETGE